MSININLNSDLQPTNENENHLIGNILAEDNSDSDQEENNNKSGGTGNIGMGSSSAGPAAGFPGKIGYAAGGFGLGAPYGGAFNNHGIPDRVSSAQASELSNKYYGHDSPQSKKVGNPFGMIGPQGTGVQQNLTGTTFSNLFGQSPDLAFTAGDMLRRPSGLEFAQDPSKMQQYLAAQQNPSTQTQNIQPTGTTNTPQHASSDSYGPHSSGSSQSLMGAPGQSAQTLQDKAFNQNSGQTNQVNGQAQQDIYHTKEYFDYYHNLQPRDSRLPQPQYVPVGGDHSQTEAGQTSAKALSEEVEKKLGLLNLNEQVNQSQLSTGQINTHSGTPNQQSNSQTHLTGPPQLYGGGANLDVASGMSQGQPLPLGFQQPGYPSQSAAYPVQTNNLYFQGGAPQTNMLTPQQQQILMQQSQMQQLQQQLIQQQQRGVPSQTHFQAPYVQNNSGANGIPSDQNNFGNQQSVNQQQYQQNGKGGKKGKGGKHTQNLQEQTPQAQQTTPPPMPKPKGSGPPLVGFQQNNLQRIQNHPSAQIVGGGGQVPTGNTFGYQNQFNQNNVPTFGSQQIAGAQSSGQQNSQALGLIDQQKVISGTGSQTSQNNMMLGFNQWPQMQIGQNQSTTAGFNPMNLLGAGSTPNSNQLGGSLSGGPQQMPTFGQTSNTFGGNGALFNQNAFGGNMMGNPGGMYQQTDSQAALMMQIQAMNMGMQNPYMQQMQMVNRFMMNNQGNQMYGTGGQGHQAPFGGHQQASNQNFGGNPSSYPFQGAQGIGSSTSGNNSDTFPPGLGGKSKPQGPNNTTMIHGSGGGRGGNTHHSQGRGGNAMGGNRYAGDNNQQQQQQLQSSRGGHGGGHSKRDHQQQPNYSNNNQYQGSNHSGSSGNRDNHHAQRDDQNDHMSQMQQPVQLPKSEFLEDLRNKIQNNKKIDIKDIKDHVVECSMDQYGSRFIQQKYDVTTPEEKELIFSEILPEANGLMNDVFGNYVVQKLFEYGTDVQRATLAEQLLGNVLKLAKSMYGCRVVQKALEVISLEQQKLLVQELKDAVQDCIYDQNGNHVIQKCIEKMPNEAVEFIVQAIMEKNGTVSELCVHTYGCRVIQRILENCHERQTKLILDSILADIHSLIKDQFGNYVIQHILEQGRGQDEKNRIVKSIKGKVIELSNHKFASNVVEKCLEFGSEKDRKEIIDEFLESTNYDMGEEVITIGGQQLNGALYTMMKDRYGNYVIQKCIEVSKGKQREILVKKITACANVLRKQANYSRHVYNFIEKMSTEGGGGASFMGGPSSQGNQSASGHQSSTSVDTYASPASSFQVHGSSSALQSGYNPRDGGNQSSYDQHNQHYGGGGYQQQPQYVQKKQGNNPGASYNKRRM